MAVFNGKNNLNTKDLFYQRLNYSVNAFPKEAFPQPITDFQFSEQIMYGRITKSHIPIVLNNSNLANLRTQTVGQGAPPLRAVNFVVDAFEAMVLDFKKAGFAGKLDNTDPVLYDISAQRAYLDPDTRYRQYIESLRNLFYNSYLTRDRLAQIKDFDSFLPFFFEFMNTMSEVDCITRSSFITSTYCNPLVSGLAIYIAKIDASDDSKKEEFIRSKNFNFYKTAAAKHGFLIDKNAPWKLIANIGSQEMQRYAAAYGINSEDEILNFYYQPAYLLDVDDLQERALVFYNDLVINNPRTRTVNDAGQTNIVCRSLTTPERVVEGYDQTYWLDKYIDIKYNELRKPGSVGKIVNLKKEVASIERVGTTTDSLNRINVELRGFDNYDGSFAKKLGKFEFLQTGIQSKPTY
jgi:hypothetical protein